MRRTATATQADRPRLKPRTHRKDGGVPVSYAPLQRIRVELDLSQEALAERTARNGHPVSQVWISRIERGAVRHASHAMLLSIAEALGTPLQDLYELLPEWPR